MVKVTWKLTRPGLSVSGVSWHGSLVRLVCTGRDFLTSLAAVLVPVLAPLEVWPPCMLELIPWPPPLLADTLRLMAPRSSPPVPDLPSGAARNRNTVRWRNNIWC